MEELRGPRPLHKVKLSIAQRVATALGLDTAQVLKGFEKPREEFGDLALVAPRIGAGIDSQRIAEAIQGIEYVASVERAGIYVNLRLDRAKFSELVLRSVVEAGESYGLLKTSTPRRIVVEYVSANPIHPLHIGTARNAALGQSVARILEAAGHVVQKRFYIDDVGREVAVVALGLKLLGEIEPPSGMKPDHWIGLVYAMTSLLIEALNLRRELERAASEDERKAITKKLDSVLADLARLRDAAPDAFEKLSREITRIDPEAEVSRIMRLYEFGEDEELKKFVRKVVELCIDGFKQTLSRFGAEFDVWDWESDLVWSSEVRKIVEELKRSPYATIHRGAPAIDFREVLANPEVRERLRIPRGLEIPPLVLMRSDGTTLYTVRDIAYTLKKFREFQADTVINVIASEQTLPQAQLRLALYILGYRREAENLIHYSYEMVTLSGMRMSSRRGRIITLDEVLEEAKSRALKELEKRGSPSEEVAERIGVAAVKFAMLAVTPSRPVKFEWETVLNFERNSAPYLFYTYARTKGIERKARELGIESDPRKLLEIADFSFATRGSERRWRLVKLIAELPEVFAETLENLDPSILAIYALRLADEFNSWYDEEPILRDQDEGSRAAKMLLTYGVSIALANVLKLLGMEPLERM